MTVVFATISGNWRRRSRSSRLSSGRSVRVRFRGTFRMAVRRMRRRNIVLGRGFRLGACGFRLGGRGFGLGGRVFRLSSRGRNGRTGRWPLSHSRLGSR